MRLYNQNLAEFRKQFYSNLLTQEHVQEGQLRIGKVTLPDGGENENYNFWGYKLVKDNTKYLLSAHGKKGNEIVLRDTLPILVSRSEKIAATKGEVFNVIKAYSSAKFQPERTMSFKEFVDSLTELSHSNPEHYKLCYFIALSQLYHRSYFRICSPPGFGKDSVIDTLRDLIGGCSTIVQPTRAKLEYRASVYNLLAINEASDIGNAEWEATQSFFLDAAAFKTSIEKQTRAFGEVGENIDISKFSLTMMYNDIMYVAEKNQEKYIDVRAHRALLDRFPPLRFHGKMTENFQQIVTLNVPEFVAENMEFYKKLIRNFLYYKELPPRHKYKRDALLSTYAGRELPERWKLSLGHLMNIVELYSESQAEFDKWVGVINSCMTDYSDMMLLHNREEYYKKAYGETKYRQLAEQAITEYKTYTERKKVFEKPEKQSEQSAYDWEKVTL